MSGSQVQIRSIAVVIHIFDVDSLYSGVVLRVVVFKFEIRVDIAFLSSDTGFCL